MHNSLALEFQVQNSLFKFVNFLGPVASLPCFNNTTTRSFEHQTEGTVWLLVLPQGFHSLRLCSTIFKWKTFHTAVCSQVVPHSSSAGASKTQMEQMFFFLSSDRWVFMCIPRFIATLGPVGKTCRLGRYWHYFLSRPASRPPSQHANGL